MKTFLVTGSAGFIGFHLSKKLLDKGFLVYGIDDLNSYYDISLKKKRLLILEKYDNFNFQTLNISNFSDLDSYFLNKNFNFVFHLAAQAGVRYSFENPKIYIDTNIGGFLNVLNCCKNHNVKKIFYASSSSVYGNSLDEKYSEIHTKPKPISLYGYTKKINEDISKSYYNLFGINSIGLRFFTVYGPWGRPDMAYYSFTDKIINNERILVFNQGKHSRSFTYIDDIIESIFKLYELYSKEQFFHDIYNIGGEKSVSLKKFIQILEDLCGKKSIKKFVPKQDGDVEKTCADCEKIFSKIGFTPTTKIEDGLELFYEWFLKYKK